MALMNRSLVMTIGMCIMGLCCIMSIQAKPTIPNSNRINATRTKMERVAHIKVQDVNFYKNPNYEIALQNEQRLRQLLEELAVKSRLVNASLIVEENNQSMPLENEGDMENDNFERTSMVTIIERSPLESQVESATDDSTSSEPPKVLLHNESEDKKVLKAQLDFLQLNGPHIKNNSDVVEKVANYSSSKMANDNKFIYMSNKTEHKLQPLPVQGEVDALVNVFSDHTENALESPFTESNSGASVAAIPFNNTTPELIAQKTRAEEISTISPFVEGVEKTEEGVDETALPLLDSAECQNSLECLEVVIGNYIKQEHAQVDDEMLATASTEVPIPVSMSTSTTELKESTPGQIEMQTKNATNIIPYQRPLSQDVTFTVNCYTEFTAPLELKEAIEQNDKLKVHNLNPNETIKSVSAATTAMATTALINHITNSINSNNNNNNNTNSTNTNVVKIEETTENSQGLTNVDDAAQDGTDVNIKNDEGTTTGTETIEKSTIEKELTDITNADTNNIQHESTNDDYRNDDENENENDKNVDVGVDADEYKDEDVEEHDVASTETDEPNENKYNDDDEHDGNDENDGNDGNDENDDDDNEEGDYGDGDDSNQLSATLRDYDDPTFVNGKDIEMTATHHQHHQHHHHPHTNMDMSRRSSAPTQVRNDAATTTTTKTNSDERTLVINESGQDADTMRHNSNGGKMANTMMSSNDGSVSNGNDDASILGIRFNATEITTTNWWRTLPYAEIRKFLNTIFDSAAHELYEEIVAARKSKQLHHS